MRGFKPFVLLVPLLPLLLGPPGRANAAEVIENLQSRLHNQQQEMHRLSKGIKSQKGMLLRARQKELALLTELEQLEQRLEFQRQRLATVKEKLYAQEDRLHRRQKELITLIGQEQELAGRVKGRLAAYYQMGEVGMLNALFSASSLPDLLDMKEYLARLLDHDRQTLATYRDEITAVNQAREQVAAQKERLAGLYSEVQEQEKQTTATQNKELALLRRVRTEKELHQVAVQEMEKAAAQLTATLEKLKEETPSPQAEQADHAGPELKPGQGFAACKGRLPPPVAGTVVTDFGAKVPGQFGITTRSRGIDIETAPGAAIKAIYPGRVVFSGYLRGYGNLLIVDHGRQYYTLMSRAARFLTEKGQEVRAGEVVGIMGEASDLPPRGLHFEIRHGSEPEDPLVWLKPQQLSPPAGKPEKIRPIFTFSSQR